MRRIKRIGCIIGIYMLMIGCVDGRIGRFYERVEVGRFEGTVILEWLRPDYFRYIAVEKQVSMTGTTPFVFIRANGMRIEPKTFETDGGSIPRPLWAIKNYSPWGYGPAYIIHDWLFYEKRCDGKTAVVFDDSAMILAEAIKTLQLQLTNNSITDNDQVTMWSIYEAVRSPIALALWNRECRHSRSVLPVIYREEYQFEK